MEAQTIRIRRITHLVFCPLLPLCGIKYHLPLFQRCQTQFQSFSSAKSSCIFRLTLVITLRSRGKRSQKEVSVIGESQRCQCSISKPAIVPEKHSSSCFFGCRTRGTQYNFLIKGMHLEHTELVSDVFTEIKLVDLDLFSYILISCHHPFVTKGSRARPTAFLTLCE